MKYISLIAAFTLALQTAYAQKSTVNEYAAIDKKALQIPQSLTNTTADIASYIKENFKTDNEKARAIFIWTASNIEYDIENMYAINFYEKKEEKIEKALKTRKGICENYGLLFSDICNKAGIESYTIEGYTKQNGVADNIPHLWVAAKIDTAWYLFDPTWGSGHANNGKFYKKLNNDYYKASPSVLIKSHMPFDYLWQFLNYPVTNQEFYEGKVQANKGKPYFSYKDSIQAYQKLNYTEQLTASADRVAKNGVKNSMIFDRLQHLRAEAENHKQQNTVNLYNAAIADHNESINDFNEFINYRNQRFIPAKPDSEIQQMLDKVADKMKAAKTKFGQIVNPDENLRQMLVQAKRQLDENEARLQEQQIWLKSYLKKNKLGRKSMFYKVTWFGVPLN